MPHSEVASIIPTLENTYGINGYAEKDFLPSELLTSPNYENDIGESIELELTPQNDVIVPIGINFTNTNNGSYQISVPKEISEGNLSEYNSYLGWDASMMQYFSKRKRRTTYLIKIAIDGFTVRDYIEKNTKLLDLITTEITPKVESLISQNIQGRVRAVLFHAGMDDEVENITQTQLLQTEIPVEQRIFSDEVQEVDATAYTEIKDCIDSACNNLSTKSYLTIHSFPNPKPYMPLRLNQEPGDMVLMANNPLSSAWLYDFMGEGNNLPEYKTSYKDTYSSNLKDNYLSRTGKILKKDNYIISESEVQQGASSHPDLEAAHGSKIKIQMPSGFEGKGISFLQTDPTLTSSEIYHGFSSDPNGVVYFDEEGTIEVAFNSSTPKHLWYHIAGESTQNFGLITNHVPAYVPSINTNSGGNDVAMQYNIIKNLVTKSSNNPEGSKKILLISDITTSEDYQWWAAASYSEDWYKVLAEANGIEFHNVPHVRRSGYEISSMYRKTYGMDYWQQQANAYPTSNTPWFLHFTQHIDDLEWKNKIRSTESYLTILEYLEQYDAVIYNCIAKNNTWSKFGNNSFYDALQAFRERGGGVFMQSTWRYYSGTINNFINRYGISFVNGNRYNSFTRHDISYEKMREQSISQHEKYFEDDGNDLVNYNSYPYSIGAYFTPLTAEQKVSPQFKGTLENLNAYKYELESDAKNINNLFSTIRSIYGNIPVFYGAVKSDKAHSEEVFQALSNLKNNEKTIEIETNDLQSYDNRHYTPTSMVELGIRYAKAITPVLQGSLDMLAYNPSFWMNPTDEEFPEHGNLAILPNLSEVFTGTATSMKSPALCGYDINGDNAIYISRDTLYRFDESPLTYEGSCSEFQMFYVIRPTTADQQGYLWWQVDYQTNRFLAHAPWSGNHYFDYGNVAGGARVNGVASVEPQLLSYRFSVSDGLGMFSQIATQSGEDTYRKMKTNQNLSPVNDSSSSFRLGGQHYNQGQDLIIGEAVIIPKKISMEDFYKIEGHLAHKWGLALDPEHPYFNFTPS